MKTRCKKNVYPRESMFMRAHQCSRYVWKDDYCKQHHPDTVAERNRKREERYEEKWKKSCWNQLREARKEIERLKTKLGGSAR